MIKYVLLIGWIVLPNALNPVVNTMERLTIKENLFLLKMDVTNVLAQMVW